MLELDTEYNERLRNRSTKGIEMMKLASQYTEKLRKKKSMKGIEMMKIDTELTEKAEL